MGTLIDGLREELKLKQAARDEQQAILDKQAVERKKMTEIRINRFHAKQEIERFEKQKKEAMEQLEGYDQNSPEFLEAQENIRVCQENQEELKKQLETYREQFQSHADQIGKLQNEFTQVWDKYTQECQARTDALLKNKTDEIVNGAKDKKDQIINSAKEMGRNTKESAAQLWEDMGDFKAAAPGMIVKKADELADNATATLSDLNDAMDSALHNAKDKGLVAFDKLGDKVLSIMRAHREKDIQIYEKWLAREQKMMQTLDKLDQVLDLKKEQAKEIGRGFKSFFTNWGNKSKAEEQKAPKAPEKHYNLDYKELDKHIIELAANMVHEAKDLSTDPQKMAAHTNYHKKAHEAIGKETHALIDELQKQDPSLNIQQSYDIINKHIKEQLDPNQQTKVMRSIHIADSDINHAGDKTTLGTIAKEIPNKALQEIFDNQYYYTADEHNVYRVQPKHEMEELVKNTKEKKPGLLRRFIANCARDDEKKLEKLYRDQIKSYSKQIERNVVREDEVIGNKYQRLEDRIQDVNRNNIEKLDDLAIRRDQSRDIFKNIQKGANMATRVANDAMHSSDAWTH